MMNTSLPEFWKPRFSEESKFYPTVRCYGCQILAEHSSIYASGRGSGFSGLAGGNRNNNGDFNNEGNNGYFWSASANGTNAWNRKLNGGNTEVNRNNNNQRNGFSVRCVRDETKTWPRSGNGAGLFMMHSR
ncbi:MAG: FISUMP domain-containing protein [Bacteroidetes bacterium]|nr:FISUMP domain-containing protein [Bacteroidota bacterium]